MTIKIIENRVKEVGEGYGRELTDRLLSYLRKNINARPHTPEILQNTFDMIPDVFEQAKKN